MMRSLLVYLGLRQAPTPVRNYLTATSVFGALPVAAFFAWKYRDQITSTVKSLAGAAASSDKPALSASKKRAANGVVHA